jgi:hypothetical protein
MLKYFIIPFIPLILLSSCEEVINVDLNSADPAFVVEAKIYKDSVSLVRLTETTSYFSPDEPGIIEDAMVKISDGTSSDMLEYTGNGYYRGDSIIGTEEKTYEIEIGHDGTIYKGVSTMPENIELIWVWFGKSEDQSIFNPNGETVFTISCVFLDNPETENYYMIRYLEDGEMIEKNYFMLTDKDAVGGTFRNSNDSIFFAESIFYEGGTVDVEVFAIDKPVYDFFLQLNDVLFWKRRVMPPTPYNPVSNIDNGALGYFTAWGYDVERIVLE